MQTFTTPPNMASPYTPVGGNNTAPTAPQAPTLGAPTAPQPSLGTPIPGTTGGLPAKPGLSVFNNPLASELQPQSQQTQNPQAQGAAQQAQQYGRGEDTMLVHMTPEEVNSLQGLAMAHGGSLTINPHTGLPEAGFLGKLLPMLLGVGLNFLLPGSGLVASLGGKAAAAGLLTAAGTTAVTGDLKKGLMAGLGAFGGASLAGGIQGAIGGAAKAGTSALPNAGEIVVTHGQGIVPAATGNVAPTVVKGLSGFGQGFANAAKGTMGGVLGKAAVPLAITGVANSFGSSGTVNPTTGAIDNSYQGPYYAQKRTATFAPTTEELLKSSKQRTYFDVDMPEIYNSQGQVVQAGSQTAPGTEIWQPVLNPKAKKGQPMYSFAPIIWQGGQDPNQMQTGYAEGGTVNMDEGGFVIPARAVAEAGNGYTDAGFERFAKMGGIPLRGKGDGVSDDIPARIGNQEARVAAGEVYMPPEAVRRAGGAKKLYALVDQAHKARKRGENSPVAKGLGAL